MGTHCALLAKNMSRCSAAKGDGNVVPAAAAPRNGAAVDHLPKGAFEGIRAGTRPRARHLQVL